MLLVYVWISIRLDLLMSRLASYMTASAISVWMCVWVSENWHVKHLEWSEDKKGTQKLNPCTVMYAYATDQHSPLNSAEFTTPPPMARASPSFPIDSNNLAMTAIYRQGQLCKKPLVHITNISTAKCDSPWKTQVINPPLAGTVGFGLGGRDAKAEGVSLLASRKLAYGASWGLTQL